MGLTFDNPNNLNKMLDKFAVVPDPKKTPKKPVPNGQGPEVDKKKEEDTDTETKTDKKSQK